MSGDFRVQDEPRPAEILAAAAAFLRSPTPPGGEAHRAFLTKVAANAIDIARRELELSPAQDAAEIARLEVLLGARDTLLELNRALCERIADGSMTLETPGLKDHLWATTLAKLAVDQPNYSGYRAALAEREGR